MLTERGRSYLLCSGAWLLLLMLAAASALAQMGSRKPAVLPSELAGTVKRDFEMQDCFPDDLASLEQQTKTEEIYLTTTTNSVLLVSGVGDCLTGSGGNAPYLLYARFGNNWRKILRADGKGFGALAAMHSGWSDLEVNYQKSASETERYIYRFTKTAYRAEACELSVARANAEQPERKPCPGWKAK